jgi:hypothetical protein
VSPVSHSGGRAQTDLARWLRGQAAGEDSAVRLEDALLGDRFLAYFWFRLRFFLARTAFAAMVHALRVALLFAAFPRDQFAAIVVVGACAAIVGDFWWGALERMRARIRHLQRDGALHRVPGEISSWLRLANRLTTVGLASACAVAACGLVAPVVAPALVYAAAIIAGAALGATVRTYHSGAYALRRIYRPFTSLIAADTAGVAALLVLWPVAGVWAFPLAEIVSVGAVVSVTLRYTARTYRVLGFPTLRAIASMRRPPPAAGALRGAVSPGVAFALVGLESLVLVAVLASSGAADTSSLLALLAALGPVIRAGFEWAQLLYFDLVRLGVPLLRGLRRRFDAAVLRLAVVMGVGTWALATLVGLLLLGIRDVALLAALLPFFMARSLLASAQVRTFTAGAYRRLSLVGAAGSVGALIVLVAMPSEAARLVGLGVVLGISFLALLALPPPADPEDRVLGASDWLARLRDVPGPTTVTHVRFDTRTRARGVTAEERRADMWRRRQIGRRVGTHVRREGGAATWSSPFELAWFGPRLDAAWIAQAAGGLVVARPTVTTFPTGAAAAEAALRSALSLDHAMPVPAAGPLLAEFGAGFPTGIVYDADRPAPRALAEMSSRERSAIMRAALRFARDLATDRDPPDWDVTALAAAGRLRAIFVVSRREDSTARRRWARAVRAWDLTVAAVGDRTAGERAQQREPLAGA